MTCVRAFDKLWQAMGAFAKWKFFRCVSAYAFPHPATPLQVLSHAYYVSGNCLTEISHCHLCSHVRVAFDSRLPDDMQGKTSVSDGYVVSFPAVPVLEHQIIML